MRTAWLSHRATCIPRCKSLSTRELGTANLTRHCGHAKCGFVLPEGLATMWSCMKCMAQSPALENCKPHMQHTGCFRTRQWDGDNVEGHFRSLNWIWSSVVPPMMSIPWMLFSCSLFSVTSVWPLLRWQDFLFLNPYVFTSLSTFSFGKCISSFVSRLGISSDAPQIVVPKLVDSESVSILWQLWYFFTAEQWSTICLFLSRKGFRFNAAFVRASFSFALFSEVDFNGSQMSETSTLFLLLLLLLPCVKGCCTVLEHAWVLDSLISSFVKDSKESRVMDPTDISVPFSRLNSTVWTWYLQQKNTVIISRSWVLSKLKE